CPCFLTSDFLFSVNKFRFFTESTAIVSYKNQFVKFFKTLMSISVSFSKQQKDSKPLSLLSFLIILIYDFLKYFFNYFIDKI
ncbi:hypothetical protein VER_10015, partial [Veillonella sp. R32]